MGVAIGGSFILIPFCCLVPANGWNAAMQWFLNVWRNIADAWRNHYGPNIRRNLSTFWRQFKVLTWKNNLLRRRNFISCIMEIAIPVALTFAMVAIYRTVKPTIVDPSTPGGGTSTTFHTWVANNIVPQCTYYDATILWRCSKSGCDPSTCDRLALAVAPQDPNDAGQVALAIGLLNRINTTHEDILVKYFDSQTDLEAYIQQPGYSLDESVRNLGGAVVIRGTAPDYSYDLRLNHTTNGGFNYNLPPTYSTTDSLLRDPWETSQSACGGRCWGSFQWMYTQSGALALQNVVESHLLGDAAGFTVNIYNEAYDFPSPRHKVTGFWGNVAPFYGVFLIISILYPVSNIIRNLVIEKEQRIREGMRMMSLTDAALFLSWYFHAATTFIIIAIIITVITRDSLFRYSNKFIVFMYYSSFFLSTTSFMFFISTFFSHSKTAAVLGIVPYFAGYFINFAIKRDTTRWAKFLACLHPSAAFSIAISALTEYEDSNIGLTFYTWSTSVTGNFAFTDALWMMALDMVIYAILTWYFDKVWPSEFGTQLPPYFFLTRDYWSTAGCCATRVHPGMTDEETSSTLEHGADVERVQDILAEQIKEGKCVVIRGLSKKFNTNTGVKQAVAGLDLTMYSGQITALLGHNGAGKSTLISMLTGLIPPSEGMALIEGKDIRHDMHAIRQNLGVCPQHDVLFNDLTVEEHLKLFASFKGVPASRLTGMVETMIKEVGLTEKRREVAKKLSGGMKRKLSVGIAFIGDSKCIFLDEPTSGMDPYSRRFTWNVIRKHREGRVIVLTTHFMDEADSDRIAIMAKGALRCCGSSLFLKNHFGVGYNMTLEKRVGCDSKQLKDFLATRIPEAQVLSDVGSEVAFQLPLSASSKFQSLFVELDDNLEKLGVETYGISVTTLEEVFIRVARGDETDHREKALIRRSSKLRDQDMDATLAKGASFSKSMKSMSEPEVDYHDGARFFRRHMFALLVKRMLYFRRDKKAWFYQFGMPGLFVLVGVLLVKLGNQSIFGEILPTLTLNLQSQHYNPKVTVDPLPIPFNDYGYGNWVNVDDGSNTWVYDLNVTGQHEIMHNIPRADTLPVYPVTVPGGWNMSMYLLHSRREFEASRYGAYTFKNITPEVGHYQLTTHANYSGVHAPSVFPNVIANAILKSIADGSTIEARLNFLPPTQQMMSQSASFDAFPMVVMIMLAFAFIPAAFAVFVVRERETKAKHLQIVSGVSFLSYWLSTWIFDYLSFQIPMWVTFLIIKFFDVKALVEGDALWITIILLQLYGLSATGFTYFTSFFYRTHSQAQVVTIMVNFIFGLILMIVTVIMSFLGPTKDVASILVYVFRVVPAFCLGNGLLNIGYVNYFKLLYNKPYTVLSMEMSGWCMVYMACESIIFFLLTLLMEWATRQPSIVKFISVKKAAEDVDDNLKDEDVLREEQRVASGTDDVVKLHDMKKVYPGGKIAVRGVSLGIPNGECFGLLGINGAGKTTTLSILTAEFPASSGEVFLGGYEISQNPEVVRRLVGYCPQFDALFDLLTGREHLELYARVKGLSEDEVKDVVDKKVKEMDLTEYALRNASTYSGGNKRKLSVAMALVGKPVIVFLDEPSTGMDPVARRFMWQVISDITHKRAECCVVLTTHSMEECEALCSRIGIMVGGRLRCLGSAQRLKSRYGMGYQAEFSIQLPELADVEPLLAPLNTISHEGRLTLSMLEKALESINKPSSWIDRISSSGSGADVWQSVSEGGTIGVREFASWCMLEERVDAVIAFIESRFHHATLRERQGAKLRYEIPPQDAQGMSTRLSTIFGTVENSRQGLHIEDYSVSQTSLEQIFNGFAKVQEEEKGVLAQFVDNSQNPNSAQMPSSPKSDDEEEVIMASVMLPNSPDKQVEHV